MPDLGQRNPLNLVLVVGENLPSNLSSPLIFVLFLSSQIFYKLAKKKFFHKTSFLSLKKGTGTSKGQENNERSQKCIQNQENKVAYPKLSDPNFLRCLYVKHTTMAQQNGLSHSIKSILKEFVIHL